MEPSDYYDAPINKVLHFIQRVNQKETGMNNRSLKVAVQGPEWPTPYAVIHSMDEACTEKINTEEHILYVK
jgi:hypothetical protein